MALSRQDRNDGIYRLNSDLAIFLFADRFSEPRDQISYSLALFGHIRAMFSSVRTRSPARSRTVHRAGLLKSLSRVGPVFDLGNLAIRTGPTLTSGAPTVSSIFVGPVETGRDPGLGRASSARQECDAHRVARSQVQNPLARPAGMNRSLTGSFTA